MPDIDQTLAQISALPLDSRLGSIDGAVFDAIAARSAQTRRVPAMAVSLAAVAAFSVGIAGAALPRQGTVASPTGLFGVATALAPSALLDPAND